MEARGRNAANCDRCEFWVWLSSFGGVRLFLVGSTEFSERKPWRATNQSDRTKARGQVMSTQYHITLTNAENGRFTMVVLDDGFFSDTWDQGILGPAMRIGSGSGDWGYFGAARFLNIWDGASGHKLVRMEGVPSSLSRGMTGQGLFDGTSPVLVPGPIEWRVDAVI